MTLPLEVVVSAAVTPTRNTTMALVQPIFSSFPIIDVSAVSGHNCRHGAGEPKSLTVNEWPKSPRSVNPSIPKIAVYRLRTEVLLLEGRFARPLER
jgi:hypothetical protein